MKSEAPIKTARFSNQYGSSAASIAAMHVSLPM
jgi:hypothetical protein